MKRIIGLIVIILFLFACKQTTENGYVGQQFLLKTDVPDEVGPFDYIWKIANLPDDSELTLSSIQFTDDESQAIFIPDVVGKYTLQVTVWKHNDKLGAIVYNYNILEQVPEIIAEQQTRDEWLNETVEENVAKEDMVEVVQEEVAVATQTVEEEIDQSVDEITQKANEVIDVIDAQPPTTPNPISTTKENFTIQVAAESKPESANALVEKLKKSGFDAFVLEHITSSNQTLYRVRVGKFATREEAASIASNINSELGLPIWVTKY